MYICNLRTKPHVGGKPPELTVHLKKQYFVVKYLLKN